MTPAGDAQIGPGDRGLHHRRHDHGFLFDVFWEGHDVGLLGGAPEDVLGSETLPVQEMAQRLQHHAQGIARRRSATGILPRFWVVQAQPASVSSTHVPARPVTRFLRDSLRPKPDSSNSLRTPADGAGRMSPIHSPPPAPASRQSKSRQGGFRSNSASSLFSTVWVCSLIDGLASPSLALIWANSSGFRSCVRECAAARGFLPRSPRREAWPSPAPDHSRRTWNRRAPMGGRNRTHSRHGALSPQSNGRCSPPP